VTLDQFSPYWGQAHEELLEVVSLLSPEQVDARPKAGAASIRDILLRFLHEERFWVSHLVAGNDYEVPRPDRFPDARSLVEALTAARDVTGRVLAPIGPDGLRAVRREPTGKQHADQPSDLACRRTRTVRLGPGAITIGRRTGA
jgi:hypothetical protein